MHSQLELVASIVCVSNICRSLLLFSALLLIVYMIIFNQIYCLLLILIIMLINSTNFNFNNFYHCNLFNTIMYNELYYAIGNSLKYMTINMKEKGLVFEFGLRVEITHKMLNEYFFTVYGVELNLKLEKYEKMTNVYLYTSSVIDIHKLKNMLGVLDRRNLATAIIRDINDSYNKNLISMTIYINKESTYNIVLGINKDAIVEKEDKSIFIRLIKDKYNINCNDCLCIKE